MSYIKNKKQFRNSHTWKTQCDTEGKGTTPHILEEGEDGKTQAQDILSG